LSLSALSRIFRSIYLLNHIGLLILRQNVQLAMNRGESYHQLRRAVSYANYGSLRFKTESEQLIWSECSRLITNCIIYYNATLLSRLLEIKEAAGEAEQVTRLGRVSPIAWQHIKLPRKIRFLGSTCNHRSRIGSSGASPRVSRHLRGFGLNLFEGMCKKPPT